VTTYNDAGRQVTSQDEDGRQTRVSFDSLGRKTKVERLDSIGATYSTDAAVYNWQDLPVTFTSATQNVTQRQYDLLGRPILEVYPDGNTSSITYTDASLYRKVTDPNGHSRESYSDFVGHILKVAERWSGGSNVTTYVYDEVGNLVTVTNPYTKSTVHTYDDLNRLTKTYFPDSLDEQYTYFDAGSLASKKGRDGLTTTYTYDDLYRLTFVDYPGSADDISYNYDSNGNPTSISNGVAWVNYTYDLKDRGTSERERFKGTGEPDLTTTFGLSKGGDLTSIVYPGTAFTLLYEPDEFHRAKRAYSGSIDYAQMTYLKDDSIQDITFGGTNGLKTTYAYDKRSRPATITTKDGSTTKWSFAYTYDRTGNVLSLSGTNIPSMTYAYDQQDRLVRATGTGWGTMTYAYDAVGNRNCLGYGTSCPQDFVLRPNGAGSKSEWTMSGSGGANWDRVDEADPADNDTTYISASVTGKTDLYALPDLTQPGPINSVTVVADAKTVWSSGCAALGCYSQVKLRVNGYASPAKDLDLGYLKVSQTWTKNPATNQNWTQADVNALEAGVENVYLSATTRVTQVYVVVNIGSGTTYAYGPMNELTSTAGIDAATYTYDANGNLATKTSDGVTWTYTYNGMGLLKEVKLGASSVAQYFYDGLGRRVKTVENGVTTFFVYGLGIDPIYEKSGTTETRHLYAAGMRIAKMVVGGATYYVHADALGSTWRMTDSAKAVVFSTSYEPFGRSWGTTGSLASSERYRFAGERNDTESGLVYLRARQYDPKVGRFVSADPVLGSLSRPQTQNRYAYVSNNPLKFVDPSGMDGEVPWWLDILTLGLASQVPKTIEWWNHASDAERWGFVAGIAVAVAIGVAIGLSCVFAGCVGLVLLAAGSAAFLGGSVGASLAYIGVTRALGGTPTQEGLSHAFYWGGWSGVAGFGIGQAAGRALGLGARAGTQSGGPLRQPVSDTVRGGERVRIYEDSGWRFRFKSFHGYDRHPFAQRGLSRDIVENEIIDDMLARIGAGKEPPLGGRYIEATTGPNGITYRAIQYVFRQIDVPTYWP
jgi:RHS repeat-associated protein